MTRTVQSSTETHYHENTDPALIRVFESARANKTRIRIFLGDPETGRDWMEEWGVEGYVGRTCGPRHSPILVNNSRSMGGGIISTDKVLRVVTSSGRRELYRHAKYQKPFLTVHLSDEPGYTHSVHRDGELVANFKTMIDADRYVAKMTR